MYKLRAVLALALVALACGSDSEAGGEAAVFLPYAARCNHENKSCQAGDESLHAIREGVLSWLEENCEAILECEVPEPHRRVLRVGGKDAAHAGLAKACCSCLPEEIASAPSQKGGKHRLRHAEEPTYVGKVSFKTFGEGMTALDRHYSEEIGDCHTEVLRRAEAIQASSGGADKGTASENSGEELASGLPSDSGDVCEECATHVMVEASSGTLKERWIECLKDTDKEPQDCPQYEAEEQDTDDIRASASEAGAGDEGHGDVDKPASSAEGICEECSVQTMTMASGGSVKERWEECLRDSGKEPQDCPQYRQEVGLRPSDSAPGQEANGLESTTDKEEDADICKVCSEGVDPSGDVKLQWADCFVEHDVEGKKPEDCPEFKPSGSAESGSKPAPATDMGPSGSSLDSSGEEDTCAVCAEAVEDRGDEGQWLSCFAEHSEEEKVPRDCEQFEHSETGEGAGTGTIRRVELQPTDVHPLMPGGTGGSDTDVCAECAKSTAEGSGTLKERWIECLKDTDKEPQDCPQYEAEEDKPPSEEEREQDKTPSEPVEVASDGDDQTTLESFCKLEKGVIRFESCEPHTCRSVVGLSTHSGQNCREATGVFDPIDAAKQCFATQHIQDVDPTGQCRPGFSHTASSLFYKHCGCGVMTASKWELGVTRARQARLLPCEKAGLAKKIVCFSASAPADSDCTTTVLSANKRPVKTCGCYAVDADGKNAELITASSALKEGLFEAARGTLVQLGCTADAIVGASECSSARYERCRR